MKRQLNKNLIVEKLLDYNEKKYSIKVELEKLIEICEDDRYRVMARLEDARKIAERILENHFQEPSKVDEPPKAA